jgi:hypothetical protein
MSGTTPTDTSTSNGWSSKYSMVLQTVTVVGLFVGAFWVAVVQPQSVRLEKLETNELSLREHEAFKEKVEGEIKAINAEILRIRTEIVPRSTHELKWKDDDDKIAHMQNELHDLRENIIGTYSTKDAIANLQKQLDIVRDKLSSNPAVSVSVPTPSSK